MALRMDQGSLFNSSNTASASWSAFLLHPAFLELIPPTSSLAFPGLVLISVSSAPMHSSSSDSTGGHLWRQRLDQCLGLLCFPESIVCSTSCAAGAPAFRHSLSLLRLPLRSQMTFPLSGFLSGTLWRNIVRASHSSSQRDEPVVDFCQHCCAIGGAMIAEILPCGSINIRLSAPLP